MELLRAHVFPGAHACHWDGAVAIDAGRIVYCGDYKPFPDAKLVDLRPGFLLPGFIDTHVHFPQIRILGRLGRSLLDWLEQCALPEEARMADLRYATETARLFVNSLLAHGTTTALVFGAHFPAATAALFEAAAGAGLKIFSGLVLSDRGLRPELLQTPDQAYRASKELIQRFQNYSVTPRFAASASEAMLEVCRTLLSEHPEVRFQTHINENKQEISEITRLFPWAKDYLSVYEKFSLSGPRSVMAHNIHATDSEISRLAAAGTAVAHCPSSNAALGSGVFPYVAHSKAGIRFGLGSDVGAGTGIGLMHEALQAYLMQRLAPDGLTLTPGEMLYRSTLAGAQALGIEQDTGVLEPGKSADMVWIRAPQGSLFEAAVERVESSEDALAAIFALAGRESVERVWIGGRVVGVY